MLQLAVVYCIEPHSPGCDQATSQAQPLIEGIKLVLFFYFTGLTFIDTLLFGERNHNHATKTNEHSDDLNQLDPLF